MQSKFCAWGYRKVRGHTKRSNALTYLVAKLFKSTYSFICFLRPNDDFCDYLDSPGKPVYILLTLFLQQSVRGSVTGISNPKLDLPASIARPRAITIYTIYICEQSSATTASHSTGAISMLPRTSQSRISTGSTRRDEDLRRSDIRWPRRQGKQDLKPAILAGLAKKGLRGRVTRL